MTTTTSATSTKKTMMAVEWHGQMDIRVNTNRLKPEIMSPTDAIVRVTAASICGTDLHLYHKLLPGLKEGDVLGHEGIGIVEEVGSGVTKIKPGQRVVISAMIACGKCAYCKKDQFNLCDVTNPIKETENTCGHHPAGLLALAHECQAEFVRIPFADINTLVVSDDDCQALGDKLVLLSDVAPTSWHACELADVGKGDVVGIWGCGSIGLMATSWAKYRGASRVIVIDCIQERLKVAESLGAEVINFNEENDITGKIKNLVPEGLDVAIDAVGISQAKSLMHKVEQILMLETDSVDIIGQAVKCVKKGGRIAIIGFYLGDANHFPVGAIMQKNLTIRSGLLNPQVYWEKILPIMKSGKVFTDLFQVRKNLKDAQVAYKVFDKKEDGVIKVLLEVGDQSWDSPLKAMDNLTLNENLTKTAELH